MIRLFVMLLLLGACAPMQPSTSPPPSLSIRYETGPCFGRCPSFTVTVNEGGEGVFTGTRFTAVTGERRFTATPEQFRDFKQALAPLRPDGEADYRMGSKLCPHAATDQASADVRWTQGSRADHLYYYFGCDMQDRSKREQLRAAVRALPIQDLIGEY